MIPVERFQARPLETNSHGFPFRVFLSSFGGMPSAPNCQRPPQRKNQKIVTTGA